MLYLKMLYICVYNIEIDDGDHQAPRIKTEVPWMDKSVSTHHPSFGKAELKKNF